MDISESWLRQYSDPPIDSDALAAALTMGGIEVEESRPVAPPFSGVVVGRVAEVRRHPNADRLTVCRVDAGDGNLRTIVCGAPNVSEGIKVPCALPGAQLPGGLQIGVTTMRGVESQGMLCSARELGLSEDHAGLLVLADSAQVGRDVRTELDLDDRVLSIKLTPNRADCLSVVGIAREVSAITDAPLTIPPIEPVPATIKDRLPVRVEAADLCGRFSGRVVRGVDARAPTPEWMQQRLLRSGQRPISALVDISNYVMLELGRPSHVFDLDKVHGALTVRWGRSGEEVELLNGQTVQVDRDVGVIADDRGVEALAGVMGGHATAVSLDTRNIYIEAAFWWPDAIRGRARRYNFSTDAAHRFERGVDYATTADHIEYLTRLVIEICGGDAGPVDDTVVDLPVRAPVSMRIERCRKVLGINVGADEMQRVFERLRLPAVRVDDVFVVTPPSYRFDLEREEDLIEEVARLHGYDRIPALPPVAPAVMRSRRETRRSQHQVRALLAALGYQELVNYSFVDPAWEADFSVGQSPIEIVNPIASQMSVMRSTLLGSLISNLVYNINRKVGRFRAFEISRVYRRDPNVAEGALQVGGIAQPLKVAGLAYGQASDEQWGVASREVDYFDVRGDVERLLAPSRASFDSGKHPALHPGRNAVIALDGRPIGVIGELHPRLRQKYEIPRSPVLFELDLEPLLQREIPLARPVPKFQPIQRDVAVMVDEKLPYASILEAIDNLSRADSRLSALREVRLFDVYRPRKDSDFALEAGANTLLNKEKSLAFRLVLQDTERPLSDTDADDAVSAIVEELSKRFGARLRQ